MHSEPVKGDQTDIGVLRIGEIAGVTYHFSGRHPPIKVAVPVFLSGNSESNTSVQSIPIGRAESRALFFDASLSISIG